MGLKAKLWDGTDLKGEWFITIKIDGVRAFWCPKEQHWFSRAAKPLYNIPKPLDPYITWDCEIFHNSFKETISATRSFDSDELMLPESAIYSLDEANRIDSRLNLGTICNPTAHYINILMKKMCEQGHEGLVLRRGKTWLKVKPEETHDVLITDVIEGTGKYIGMLGAFVTHMGKVGTGLDDIERKTFWEQRDSMIGQTIEVSCMHLTDTGKFRHPRFVRLRPDKIAEK